MTILTFELLMIGYMYIYFRLNYNLCIFDDLETQCRHHAHVHLSHYPLHNKVDYDVMPIPAWVHNYESHRQGGNYLTNKST